MRRAAALVLCLACAGLILRGQSTPAPATPPAQGAPQTPPAPSPADAQQPVFRGQVDIIRLDVSVLDKDRHPVHGLTVDDFTVTEDGKPQRIVAVSEVNISADDPAPSAWMRHTPADVTANDLMDKVGDGRVFAIVMDDWTIPYDAGEMILSAREIGRYLVDQLGPSDVAAVVYTSDASKTQDFTADRDKLYQAIDLFQPKQVSYMESTPQGTGQGGGDMPYRYSSALARTTCMRLQPAVPTLDTLTSQLATIPNRRKTVVFVSLGLPISFAERTGCPLSWAEMMKDVFTRSQRNNINIYSIDPAGYRGLELYLQDPLKRAMRGPTVQRTGPPKLLRDFLEIVADYTGARAIVNTDSWKEVDDMLAEASSYYLVGYQTSNGAPDGKYRKVDVKVKKPGVTARTKAGFYAQKEGTLATPEARNAPTGGDLGLTGMSASAALPLRGIAVAVARGAGAKDAEVAIVLTVRLPAPVRPIEELVSVIRNLYDSESRPGPPAEEKVQLTLQPTTGDEFRYDLQQRLTLAPGRYELRLNATSRAMGTSGSVYVPFEVPDFTRPSLSTSVIVLGTRPENGAPRTDRLGGVIPIVPTTARDFSPNESTTAFVRVFQGGSGSLGPVTVTTELMDVSDVKVFEDAKTLAPEAFDARRSAPFEVAVPLSKLSHGPYLLSISAAAGNTKTRRDVVFRVR